ncbi:MAG: dihydrofolate reductase, partial [Muribaculaceae bacterium]|nr:dihydrofolate reductase [Muribaculaceae bacterium]
MISIIVAIDRGGAIGRSGDLLYHIREDLRHFKALTVGNTVVMGRKTFESLPKGALPDRRNIVVTRNAQFSAPDIETAPSLEKALEMAADGPGETFIIGGGKIYARALP